jgi:deoxyinosine 3'endonuclease (endonuclease V)
MVAEGETVGYVLRNRDRVKPVFVSPGHRIGFDEACAWRYSDSTETTLTVDEPPPTVEVMVEQHRLRLLGHRSTLRA